MRLFYGFPPFIIHFLTEESRAPRPWGKSPNPVEDKHQESGEKEEGLRSQVQLTFRIIIVQFGLEKLYKTKLDIKTSVNHPPLYSPCENVYLLFFADVR